MTKLRIIARLWSHVTDLKMLAEGNGKKTMAEIEKELDITEYYCRLYADADDVAKFVTAGKLTEKQFKEITGVEYNDISNL